MCIAYPMKILKIENNEALCEYNGVKATVNTALVTGVKIGDYVLVHTGFALEKVDFKEAKKILKLHKEILTSV